MRMPLRIRPEAESDLDHAYSWYEERRAGLGLEFLDEIEACLARVAETSDGRLDMAISLYDATVAGFLQTVGALEGVLGRGFDYCRDNGVEPAEIVAKRLHPDMLPFRFQVNSVVQHSAGAISGVRAGVFRPDPGPELDYGGLQQALADARTTLEGVSRDEIEGFVGRDVVFMFRDRQVPYRAEDFLLSFSIPNFYFHATTAYGLLRAQGVPLGKRDFLGRLRIKT